MNALPFGIEAIRADRIVIDDTYQRPILPAHVRRIRSDLDLDALGVIIVSRRGGKFYCIDGQHRLAALMAEDLGDWEVTCKVYESLTPQQEATIFIQANATRKPSALDIFHAALTAREPEALAINGILKRHGLRASDTSSDGNVACVTVLRSIYQITPMGSILDKTLSVAIEAFGLRRATFEGNVLGGIAIVLNAYEDQIDRAVLIHKLAKTAGGASGLIGRARTLRDVRTASIQRLVASVIVTEYNKGRRSGVLSDL